MAAAETVAWVKPPEPIRGLDHLGVQAPCIALYGQLLPGITNVTDRARYYSFHPWVVWAFERRYPDHSVDEFRRVLRRAECLFALIAIRHARVVGDNDDGVHGRAMVGRDKLLRIAEDAEGFALEDYATLEGPNRYFKSKLGGLGQYYFGPLRDLRVLDHHEGAGYPGYDEQRGRQLAEAFANAVPQDAFFRVLEQPTSTWEELDELEAFCPCKLHENAAEHELLLDLFLARTEPFQADGGTTRRASLGLMLDLVSQPARDPEYAFEGLLRGAAYTGALVDASGERTAMALPAYVQEYFGDFRWWERPRCFGDEQCARLVSNLDEVRAELIDLYPADVCRDLVESGNGSLVLGLFMDDGFLDHVGEVLLLGEDLRLCRGWREKPGLVAGLRRPRGFAPARFEVGVWAGLRRAGVDALYSDGTGATPAADFEFEDGGRRVAMELKYVGSSDRDRNYGIVEDAVNFACRPSRRDLPHKLTIALAPQILQDIEDLDVDQFREQYGKAVHRSVIDVYRQADGRVPFGPISAPPLGDVAVTALPPNSDPRLVLQTSIEGYEEDSLEQEVRRALRPLRKKAAGQLLASRADLRVAVVWTGRSNVPIRQGGPILASFVAPDPDSYGAMDYIVVLNAHRLGPKPGWTTEAVAYCCPWARHELDGMRWPGALVDWKYLPF